MYFTNRVNVCSYYMLQFYCVAITWHSLWTHILWIWIKKWRDYIPCGEDIPLLGHQVNRMTSPFGILSRSQHVFHRNSELKMYFSSKQMLFYASFEFEHIWNLKSKNANSTVQPFCTFAKRSEWKWFTIHIYTHTFQTIFISFGFAFAFAKLEYSDLTSFEDNQCQFQR